MKKILLALFITGGITSGSFAQSLTTPLSSKPYQGLAALQLLLIRPVSATHLTGLK